MKITKKKKNAHSFIKHNQKQTQAKYPNLSINSFKSLEIDSHSYTFTPACPGVGLGVIG